MTASDSPHDAGDELAAQRRRLEVCVRFEKAWRGGQRPEIEPVCLEVPESERPALLHELLAVEVELRLAAGERPTPEECYERFSELASSIPLLFEEVKSPCSPIAPRRTDSPKAGLRPKQDPAYNLLFGLLALQNNFIDRDALLAAFNSWVTDKTRAIGQLLVERGVLDRNRHAILEALVQEHLKHHGDDPQQSLAALSSIGSMQQELEQLADSELTASVAYVSAARLPSDSDATSTWDASSALRGDRFPILHRFDAKGNLGELYVAHDLELHREVLLKQVKEAHADQGEIRARFLVEAEITGNLEHPGIVPVYGLGKYANGRPFYVMRRIKGQSLKDAVADFHQTALGKVRLGEQNLAFQRLLRHFIDVCNTIAYAHSRGILHRDIKPANIMIGSYGETIVIDWGLAKQAGHHFESSTPRAEGTLHLGTASGSPETVAGSLMGTPQFMSPEQAAGQSDRAGPASDVYSLGATMYVLLTGSAPFQGSVSAVRDKVQRGEFAPPSQLKSHVPRALEAVCQKAMALRPEDRYASAGQLASEIERWLADEPVKARRESLGERLTRWARHHKPLITGAVVVSLLVPTALAVIAVAWEQRNVAKREKLTQQYFSLITPPPEAARRMGWTWDRLADLKVAASLNVPQRDSARLRSEVADCLATVDLREVPSSERSYLVLEPDLLQKIPDPSVLAFSSDGRYMALGQDKTTFGQSFQVRLVDRITGSAHTFWAKPTTLSKPEGARAIAFTPDGNHLIVGTRQGRLHHWDLTTHDPQPVSWQGHSGPVSGIVISPDNKWVFSSSSDKTDKTVKRWELATIGPGIVPVVEVLRFEDGVDSMKGEPFGKWLACAVNDQIHLVEQPTLKRISTRFHIGVRHLAIAPDGRLLAASVGGEAGIPGQRVMLLDLERNQEVRRFQDPELLPGQSHERGDLDLEFSPDGSLLVSASSNDEDHMVKVWEVGSGRLVAKHPATAVKDTSFTPDGHFLALTTATGATLFEVRGLAVQTRMASQANPISAIACDQQGQSMACASGSRSLLGQVGDPDITVWSLTQVRQRVLRRIVPRQDNVGLCTHLAWLPDASALASSWTSDRIVVVPLKDAGEPRTLDAEANSQLSAIGVASDGVALWAAAGNTLWRWSTVDWSKNQPWRNVTGLIKTGKVELRSLVVGRKCLIVGGRDGSVRLFDAVNTPVFRREWGVSTEPITQVALSPDERLAVAGSLDGSLALFDLQTLQEPLKQKPHGGAIESLAFSKDGRLLATGSKDQTIQFRSVSVGFAKVILTLRSPTGPITALSFSDDGNQLYTVVRGETAVRIWHLDALKEILKSFNLDWQ